MSNYFDHLFVIVNGSVTYRTVVCIQMLFCTSIQVCFLYSRLALMRQQVVDMASGQVTALVRG